MTESEILEVLDYLTEEKEKYLELRKDCIRDRNVMMRSGVVGTFEYYLVEQRIAKYDGKVELLGKFIDKIENDFSL